MQAHAQFIRDFYHAIGRDLAIYATVLVGTAAVGVVLWYFRRTAFTLGFALAAAAAATLLAGAAVAYRGGLAASQVADLAALQAAPVATAEVLVARYGPHRAFPHFHRLALIWSGVIATALLVGLAWRRPAVQGAGVAIAWAAALSLLLDYGAMRRDVLHAARFTTPLPGLAADGATTPAPAGGAAAPQGVAQR